jgi:Zn-dependent protease with chaperone function
MFAGVAVVALAYSIVIWSGIFLLVAYFQKKWDTLRCLIASYLILALASVLMGGALMLTSIVIGLAMIFVARMIVLKFKLTRYP